MNNTVKIIKEVKKAISGKDEILLWVLTTLLAKGNVLLEDIPGVGKTTLVLAFSKALGLSYGRVQFNPDVLPSDITGFSMYKKDTDSWVYQKGAIMCNLFLADELNRATSRTQAALLEAMEEKQVSVDGVSYKLPEPFFVIATQNPTGAAGTQLLPDSQIDRFMISLSIGYPSSVAEGEMVKARLTKDPLKEVNEVVTREDFILMQEEVEKVFIKDEIVSYIVELVQSTRKVKGIIGASPRATLALTSISKAIAYIKERDYVLPEDVKEGFEAIIPHRIVIVDDTKNIKVDNLIASIIASTPEPRV